MESVNVGYWGPRTASEDWCEPNYVYSHYIAEFWNVMSSFPIVFMGLWVVYNAIKYKYKTRFLVPGFFMASIGLGSIWFHGTLMYEGQVLDELSMIYAMVCYLYVLVEDKPKIKYKWLPYALFVYCVGFTVTYAYLPQYFIYFVLTFIGGSALTMYWSYKFVQIETDPRLVRQYWICFFVWTGAFFFCWIPDKLFCSSVQWLNLHAIFHLCSAMCPMSILMYICRCHYQFDLARRTGLIVDHNGSVVTAPNSLLKVLVVDGKQEEDNESATIAFPTYKFVKVGRQVILPYVHLRRKEDA